MNIEAQSRALRQLAAQLVHDDAQADDPLQDAWVDALRAPGYARVRAVLPQPPGLDTQSF